MIRLRIHLPAGARLDVAFTGKSRVKPDVEPLLPSFGTLLRVKRGSRISRFFRHIFQHVHLPKLVGMNFAAFAIILASTPVSGSDFYALPSPEVKTPLVMSTVSSIQYPVHNLRITQGYSFYHQGADLDGITGDKIYPIAAGKVVEIENTRFGYGNAVYVDHGDGIVSLYAHLSKINVSLGDTVTKDTLLGLMGATGRAFGDHLHLEIRENGRALNPIVYLSKS